MPDIMGQDGPYYVWTGITKENYDHYWVFHEPTFEDRRLPYNWTVCTNTHSERVVAQPPTTEDG